MDNIKTEWLAKAEKVKDDFNDVLTASGRYVHMPEEAETAKEMSKLFKMPENLYCWSYDANFLEASNKLEQAVYELRLFSNQYHLKQVCFSSPLGKLLTSEDLMDWCDWLLKEWEYPSIIELQEDMVRHANSPSIDIWPLDVFLRLTNHITQDLDEQFDQIRREIEGEPRSKAGQPTFEYNKRKTTEGSEKVVGAILTGKKGVHPFTRIPALAFAEYARASNEGVDDPKKIEKRVVDNVPDWHKYKKSGNMPRTQYVRKQIQEGIKKATGNRVIPFNPLPFYVDIPK